MKSYRKSLSNDVYWFVFDRRGNFQSYVASFFDENEAHQYGEEHLGEYAYVTSDLSKTLVRVKTVMF